MTGGKTIVTLAPKQLLRHPKEDQQTGFSTLLQPDGDVVVRGCRPEAFIHVADWQRYCDQHGQQVQQYLRGIKQSIAAIMSIFATCAGLVYSLCVLTYEREQYGSRHVPVYFHFIYTALLVASFVVPGWKDLTRRLIMRSIFTLLSWIARNKARRYIRQKLNRLASADGA